MPRPAANREIPLEKVLIKTHNCDSVLGPSLHQEIKITFQMGFEDLESL